jgi:hypothetical protein
VSLVLAPFRHPDGSVERRHNDPRQRGHRTHQNDRRYRQEPPVVMIPILPISPGYQPQNVPSHHKCAVSTLDAIGDEVYCTKV